MEWNQVCEKYAAEALRATLNWKASGRDQIPNFWFKLHHYSYYLL
jgi:hypothetical protein